MTIDVGRWERALGFLRRKTRLALGLALVAGVALGSVSGVPSSTAEETDSGVVQFGAYPEPTAGQTREAAGQALETELGRPLDVVRVFQSWSDNFPGDVHTWAKAGSRTLLLSVKPIRSNGEAVSWSTIANAPVGGQVDAEIRSWARRVRDYGVPIYVTLHHEPEAAKNTGFGTAADFVAAWRHWVDVFRQEGATNASFMWITTDYAHWVVKTDRRYAAKWYPGDAWVDSMGIDAYNWFTCRVDQDIPWKTLRQIIDPFKAFGALHPDKELWLTEWATTEDPAQPGTRKAEWFDAVDDLLAEPAYQQFAGISYFNSSNHASTEGRPGCDWAIDTTPAAQAAFVALGTRSIFGGSTPPPPPPPPANNTARMLVGSPALSPGDEYIRSLLRDKGFTVTVQDDNDTTTTVTEGVLVISSSVDSATVGTRFRDVGVPTMVYKPWLLGPMGMVPPQSQGSTTSATVDITNPGSPLAAGLTGKVAVLPAPGPLLRGAAPATSDVVATVGGVPSLFAYQGGDVMAGGLTAPSCRVALPVPEAKLTGSTSAGRALIEAAIDWSRSC